MGCNSYKETYFNIEKQIEDNPFNFTLFMFLRSGPNQHPSNEYKTFIIMSLHYKKLHCTITVASPARTVKVVQNMKSMQAIDSSSQTKLCKQLQGSRLCQPGNFGHLFNTVLGGS